MVRPGRALEAKQLLRLSSDGVCVDAVKRAEREDCLVVRLHECRGGRHQVKLTSDYPLAAYAPCNLLEKGGEKVPGAEVCFEIKPFELKTFKLWFEA